MDLKNLCMQKGLTSYYLLLFVIGSLLMASCSNTKYLSEKETLYVGPKVKVEDSTIAKKVRKDLEDELEDIVRPKPNASFLGLRYKLFVYNIVGKPKSKKGLRAWVRNKIGEPPVLGSDLNIKTNTKIISNYLENQGYLHAYSDGEKVTKKKRTKAEFHVFPGPQSTIRNIEFYDYDDLTLSDDIRNTKETSFLKPGDPYNLDLIKKERLRVSDNLKLIGYYYFSPDYLLIVADTGIGNNQVDLEMKLKMEEMPVEAFHPYTINDVVVVPDYRLVRDSKKKRKSKENGSNTSDTTKPKSVKIFGSRTVYAGDTTYFQSFKIVDREKNFKPKVFKQAMQLRNGDLYNKNEQNKTLNRLVTLGTFKFVKNEFTPVQGTDKHLLDLTYLLTPSPKKSLSFEIGGFTQDDSRLGSRASLSWRNRNFLKGAELFTIKPTVGFEMQYGGEEKRPNTYNYGIEASLNVPRLIVPFFNMKPAGMFIPRTLINLSYNHTFKGNYYKINTYSLGIGYNWKENIMKDHKLFPINISYVHTDTLNKDSISTINLSNLIYNGLIIGPTYEFTYNTQLGKKSTDNFYFFGSADLSGNILGLAQGASINKPKKDIFGANYAQYLKFQTDFRYYHDFSEQSIFAARLFLGFGYPYGNSYQLPNIKQFYSGGSSSLRGFASRLVGPGTYNERYDEGNNTFIEMLGDIKQELNVEWRIGIYKFIHGAIFADAGNIWLLRDNTDFPGGQFTKNFYKEIAVDMGIGIRFDLSILVLRLDLGIPVRKPWYPEGERWRFNDIHFAVPEWRNKNLFLNVAIGYPF